MASELEVLKQRIIELEVKNAELEAEKAKLLKWIMEENTRRDIITFMNQKFLSSNRTLLSWRNLSSRNIEDSSTSNLDDSGNSLTFSRFTPIPPRYLELLESEIFCETAPLDSTTSELWKKFEEWTGFEKVPNYKKKFKHYCHRLWTKTKYAYKLQVETQRNPPKLYDIPEVFLRHPDDKLFIADEMTKKVAGGINLDGFKYVYQPQCFKNAVSETIIDFFDLNNPLITKTAQVVVDQYYNHTLNNSPHWSNQFTKNLIEHFGCFTDSNNEPYTTTSTASTHCQEHQKCVQDLIRGLQPISDAVNNYINSIYPALYEKMRKLDLGPNVPKSFGAFPTVGINFNYICQFHRDLKDHRNTLCVVCPLGVFEGGQLAFPELKLAINAKQGQAIAFRSHLLIHGNLPITAGSRHSVVFYLHDTVIKQKRKFSSLFDDGDLDISDNAERHHKKPRKYSPPKLGSRKSTIKLRNHRQSHLDLEPARRGLPAQPSGPSTRYDTSNSDDTSEQTVLQNKDTPISDVSNNVLASDISDNALNSDVCQEETKSRVSDIPLTQCPTTSIPVRKAEFHSSEVKIPYNQKIEQGIIQEVILFIQKEKMLTSLTNIPETQDSIIKVSEDKNGRELARLFSDAEIAEGKTIKAKQKEIICWYTYRKSYQNTVAEIRTKTGVSEKTAKSQVYAIIKASLPKVSEANLRKKTQRAGSVYKLFEKTIDPTTKKEVKGIGIDKVYGISYGTRSKSELTDTQILNIINRIASIVTKNKENGHDQNYVTIETKKTLSETE
ncbi:3766_t:CDS:2, partial [Acaulospora morrowiae]